MTITQHQTLLGFYKKALIDSVAIEEDLLKESNKAILELDEFKVKGIFRRAGFPTPALYYYKDFLIRNFIYNNNIKDNIS